MKRALLFAVLAVALVPGCKKKKTAPAIDTSDPGPVVPAQRSPDDDGGAPGGGGGDGADGGAGAATDSTPGPTGGTGNVLEHELFQAASVTTDATLMTQVMRRLGIVTRDGTPNEKMEAFMNAHVAWSQANVAWIREHAMDPAKARAFLAAHPPQATPSPSPRPR